MYIPRKDHLVHFLSGASPCPSSVVLTMVHLNDFKYILMIRNGGSPMTEFGTRVYSRYKYYPILVR